MKQLFIILLAFVYLTSTAGVNVEMHYCHGKLKSVSLASILHKDCCCKMKAAMKNGCCKTEVKTCKLNENHKPEIFSTIPDFSKWIQVSSLSSSSTLYFTSPLVTEFNSNPPPDLMLPVKDISVFNQTFRI